MHLSSGLVMISCSIIGIKTKRLILLLNGGENGLVVENTVKTSMKLTCGVVSTTVLSAMLIFC